MLEPPWAASFGYGWPAIFELRSSMCAAVEMGARPLVIMTAMSLSFPHGALPVARWLVVGQGMEDIRETGLTSRGAGVSSGQEGS